MGQINSTLCLPCLSSGLASGPVGFDEMSIIYPHPLVLNEHANVIDLIRALQLANLEIVQPSRVIKSCFQTGKKNYNNKNEEKAEKQFLIAVILVVPSRKEKKN